MHLIAGSCCEIIYLKSSIAFVTWRGCRFNVWRVARASRLRKRCKLAVLHYSNQLIDEKPRVGKSIRKTILIYTRCLCCTVRLVLSFAYYRKHRKSISLSALSIKTTGIAWNTDSRSRYNLILTAMSAWLQSHVTPTFLNKDSEPLWGGFVSGEKRNKMSSFYFHLHCFHLRLRF